MLRSSTFASKCVDILLSRVCIYVSNVKDPHCKLLKLSCQNLSIDRVHWQSIVVTFAFDLLPPKCIGIFLSTSCIYVWNMNAPSWELNKYLSKSNCWQPHRRIHLSPIGQLALYHSWRSFPGNILWCCRGVFTANRHSTNRHRPQISLVKIIGERKVRMQMKQIWQTLITCFTTQSKGTYIIFTNYSRKSLIIWIETSTEMYTPF